MKYSFQDKQVVVVGATGGLGSAVARTLTEQGANVIAVGRDRAKLDRLVMEQDAQLAYSLDLAAPDQLIALRDFITANYGAVDIVINASGIDVRKPLDAHTPAEVRRLLDVNLGGAIGLTQALLPIMREGSTIVHVGGFADGRLAFPYYSVDVATRAGLFSFGEAINRELALAHWDVLVSYFSPSPTDTDAERPFHPIWREMGVAIAPIEYVVQELFETITRRQAVHIMGGFTTRLFARLNAVWPGLADRLMMKRYGHILHRNLIGDDEQPAPRSRWSRWFGLGLMVLSFMLYGGLLLVSLAPVQTALKITLAPVLIGLGEATFWIGGLLIGKELVTRNKRFLNPCYWLSCKAGTRGD